MRIEARVEDGDLAALDPGLEEVEILDGRDLSATGLRELSRLDRLRVLRVERVKKGIDSAVVSWRLPNLEVLSLRNCKGLGAKGLQRVGEMKTLRVVDVGFCSGVHDSAVAHVAALPRLQSLSLHCCIKITDTALEHVGAAVGLVRLDVGACQIHLLGAPKITAAGVAHLARLDKLTWLDVGNNRGIGDPATEHLTAFAGTLTDLRMTHIHDVSSDGWQKLAQLRGLEALDLKESQHIDDGVLATFGEALTRLRTLNLSHCGRWPHSKIGDAGLCALGELPSLETLGLELALYITDAGIEHVTRMPALKELGLYGNAQVTAGGLRALAGAPKLERLSLGGDIVDDALLSDLLAPRRLRHLNLSYADKVTASPLRNSGLDSVEVYNCRKLSQAAADAALAS